MTRRNDIKELEATKAEATKSHDIFSSKLTSKIILLWINFGSSIGDDKAKLYMSLNTANLVTGRIGSNRNQCCCGVEVNHDDISLDSEVDDQYICCCGAISTRSLPLSLANLLASLIKNTPSCFPSESITLTFEAWISSLTRILSACAINNLSNLLCNLCFLFLLQVYQ